MKLREAVCAVCGKQNSRKEGKEGKAVLKGALRACANRRCRRKKKPLRLKIDRIVRHRKEDGIHAVSAIRNIFIRTTSQNNNIY